MQFKFSTINGIRGARSKFNNRIKIYHNLIFLILILLSISCQSSTRAVYPFTDFHSGLTNDFNDYQFTGALLDGISLTSSFNLYDSQAEQQAFLDSFRFNPKINTDKFPMLNLGINYKLSQICQTGANVFFSVLGGVGGKAYLKIQVIKFSEKFAFSFLTSIGYVIGFSEQVNIMEDKAVSSLVGYEFGLPLSYSKDNHLSFIFEPKIVYLTNNTILNISNFQIFNNNFTKRYSCPSYSFGIKYIKFSVFGSLVYISEQCLPTFGFSFAF